MDAVGVARVNDGGAVSRERLFKRRTSDAGADGEVVWSWRPDAGAKPCMMRAEPNRASDALRSARRRWQKSPVTGESAYKPLKPLRREGRAVSAEPVVLPRAFLLHADHGCGQHPAFPVPSLLIKRASAKHHPDANRAAGTRSFASLLFDRLNRDVRPAGRLRFARNF
jgi:hypothetical protein